MYVDTSCFDSPATTPAVMQRASGHSRTVFAERGGVTVLDRLYQEGAAKVRLPRSRGARQEAVVINTAGGLTGGDRFAAEVVLRPGARAMMTTQACERIYRSAGGQARMSARIVLGADTRLDWLPQETIMFDGGRLARRFEADLSGNAELVALEAVIFGREAMGETVRTGLFHDHWRISRNGALIFADDLRLEDEIASLLDRPSVLNGNRAMATALLVAPDCERLLDPVRTALGAAGGASAWKGKLVMRLAAADGFQLRRALLPALAVLMDGRALPKVWEIPT